MVTEDKATASSVCTIGLDVGGTKMAAGLVRFPSGEILAQEFMPTLPKRGGAAILSDAISMVERLAAKGESIAEEILGVGVAVAELVDADGNVTSGQTIAWQGVRLHERFGHIAPTTIEADVRAAAFAESLFGAGRLFNTFAYVTVGTGISSTLVIDGQPFAGARGNALVLASGRLTVTCPKCGEAVDEVLEEVAAGPALVSRYVRATSRTAASAEDVFRAVTSGDKAACSIVESAGDALGNSVGFLINVVDPEAVIVGGGLGLAGGPNYWDRFVSATRDHIWSESARSIPILRTLLGVDGAMIGAAATAYVNVLPVGTQPFHREMMVRHFDAPSVE